MHTGHHIFTMNPRLPITLLDKLLTAVEAVLIEEGASHVWIDSGVVSNISVRADFPVLQAANSA